MSLFLDASAWVAIVTNEPGAFALEATLGATNDPMYSAMSLWETIRAIAQQRSVSTTDVRREIDTFIHDFGLRFVPIGELEAGVAIDAHRRYGKGSHPARLNMGDCFAYACAKTNGAKLLYKGDDFARTDLA